jgi:glycosyltransferase involved in cell wall biosynthesis
VTEPRVSVLLRAYEQERYIARALDSILDQCGVGFEVLVGDDAATDGTRGVIDRYARAHPGLIRTFFPERNLGHGGNGLFAALLGRARGEYVAPLDGDDFVTSPAKLRRQVAYMDDHSECAVCFHDVLCHHEDGSRPDARFIGPRGPARVDLPRLLKGCQIAFCGAVFRREAIHPLPDWYLDMPWSDAPLYILAVQQGTIDYLPDVMAVYRFHDRGKYRGMQRLRVLELQTGYYTRLPVPPRHAPHLRRKLADTWTKLGLEHERLGHRASARDCLAESLRVHPFEPRRLRERRGERQRLVLRLLLKAPAALTRRRRTV